MVCKGNEIQTRPVELLPKLMFTVYASFIVTCFICHQQLATFLHGHIFDTHCFQLTFNIARLNSRNNFMCWFAVTVNERSEVNRNKMKTIHITCEWSLFVIVYMGLTNNNTADNCKLIQSDLLIQNQ